MIRILCLLVFVTWLHPAAAQEAVATDLPPSLRAKLEKAKAAADAKANQDKAVQDKAATAKSKDAQAKEAREAKEAQAREAKEARDASAREAKASAAEGKAGAPARPVAGSTVVERKPPEPPSNVAADGSSGEPVVVMAKVEKCLECKTTTKKRVAVLPTRVGSVAADAGASPESLGQIVSDKLEAILKARPELLVLGRGSLQGVLAEQDLGAKGVTNAELAPQRGRVIPAELLLHVTLDRVDVGQNSKRVASSTAAATVERAHQIEREAMAGREQALVHERSAQEALRSAQQMREQNQQTQAQAQAQAQKGTLTRGGLNLSALSAVISSYGEAYSTREAEQALEAAAGARLDADRKVLQARQMKEQAERTANTEVMEEKKTSATITVVWRTVDTVTGEMLAGDTITLSDSIVDRRRVTGTAGSTTETSQSTRGQALVNKLIDSSVAQVADKMSASLDKVPFRGRIVRVDKGSVIINVGRNLGVEPGDTFAVRRIDTSLIDPATGRSLAGPGTLEGMIRVAEVSDQVAKAEVLQTAGKLARGDILEWVGIFK
jgi:Curli production assembly/transport component CsgG